MKPVRMWRRNLIIGTMFSVCSLVAVAACTEDDIAGPGFQCDITNPVADLFLSPSSSLVLVHSPARDTDTTRVSATATNRLGGTRDDVPIKFVSSDTTIATVDSMGIVHARKPGSVRITASACGESASSQLTVALVALTVKVKLDTSAVIAGDSVLVTGRAFAGDTVAIPAAKFSFTASPAAGITIVQRSDSTAIIKTSSSGTFTITASGEGVAGSASLLVAPRIFVGSLASGEGGLDVGRDFACGLIPLGRLYCWGTNNASQLGTTTDSTCFDEGFAGATNSCSLLPLRVGPQLVFSSISSGDGFACGIATLGAAYCWGNGNFGKLGTGSNGGAGSPTLVTSALSFSTVTAGGNHACGIASGGATYCWGQDSAGQLGDARRINSTTPIPVSGGGSVAVFASISAGFRHTCAIQTDGTAFCWGQNDNGQLGTGGLGGDIDTPGGVAGGLRFTAISAGGDTVIVPPAPPRYESHTCGIAVGGAAYCWGSNASGQLGIGSIGGPDIATPTPVLGGLAFAKISAGGRYTCGLTIAGAVYCWGHNDGLQLGRGPSTGGSSDSGTPQAVTGGELPSGVTFTTISAGKRHSCGVGSDGAAYCWGSNVFGALGNTLQAAFRGFPQKVATPK